MASFIALALQSISDGIDVSVAAWEKRDYWVKADKFRMEWMWTGQFAEKMKTAVLSDDWATIACSCLKSHPKLNKVEVSDNHRLGQALGKRLRIIGIASKVVITKTPRS